jgi:uncharacterized protein involved in response to NO
MKTPLPPLVIARQDAAPAHAAAPRGWPVLRLGLRPFYLGAALFAMLAVPLWIAMLLGALTLDLSVSPVLWPAHEMLFGFAAAVIVGFLLTAYLLVSGAAVVRVLLPLLAPQQLMVWLTVAAAAWAAAFGIYLFVFAPWLVSPRVDGKDG